MSQVAQRKTRMCHLALPIHRTQSLLRKHHRHHHPQKDQKSQMSKEPHKALTKVWRNKDNKKSKI